MEALDVIISPCPNDVYIFAGLILGTVAFDGLPLRFDFQDVETCNQWTADGRGDVVKISYANYPRIADTYERLSSGGALGRGVGPLLLTNGNTTFDPTRCVLSPGQFTTANFLLNFWEKKREEKREKEERGSRNTKYAEIERSYLPFDVLYETLCRTPGAQGVVIHEKRFTYAKDGLTLLVDLGDFWEQETGFAIPLGAIVLRRTVSEYKERLETAIRTSLTWARENPVAVLNLCRRYAQEMSDPVMQAHIDLYVNEYSYDLGNEGEAAVAFFLQALVNTHQLPIHQTGQHETDITHA